MDEAFANYHVLLNLPLIQELKQEITSLKRENERMRNILLNSIEAQLLTASALLPPSVVKYVGSKVSDSFYPVFIKEEKNNIETSCNVRCEEDETLPVEVPPVPVPVPVEAPVPVTAPVPVLVPVPVEAPVPVRVEATDEEEEEEEEEEEVEELVIDGVTYFATGTEDGSKVYSCVDDDVGDLVGTLQGGVLNRV